MDERKSLFFYPNVCHVCKEFPKSYELKRCSGCKMIFYCSNAHQKLHWSQHKELCKTIRDLLSKKNVHSLTSQNFDRKTWLQKQMNLMLLAGIKMKRRLRPYEEEMFKFAKVCTVCFDDDPKLLEDCQNCPSASFCQRHKDNPGHNDVCALFKLSFDLDLTGKQFNLPLFRYNAQLSEYAIMELSQDKSEDAGQDLQGTNVKNKSSSNQDMYNRTINSAVVKKDLPIAERAELAHITEVYTRPFCIFYAIKHLKYHVKCNMVIHVVGANMIEMANLEVWEMLLHTLPTVVSQKIVLVGPELPWHNIINLTVCQSCLALKKKVQIEVCNSLYKNYELSGFFERPDIIVAYNAGIHEQETLKSGLDTWAESLHSIAKQNCPFVVTSYTSEEAHKDEDRIKFVLGEKVNPIYCGVCPYASVRPYRDFESGGVYYQNQYIIMYHRLIV